jgi:hypothetical protein
MVHTEFPDAVRVLNAFQWELDNQCAPTKSAAGPPSFTRGGLPFNVNR